MTIIPGRLETLVLGIGVGAYDESLSANTVGEDNSIRKTNSLDFLKPSDPKFQIQDSLEPPWLPGGTAICSFAASVC